MYIVVHQKTRLLFFSITLANIDGFSNFSTAIFSKELRNKNLLKFSPHLKSVATLPCETWNVKCVDIQQCHIQFKTDAKCQVTVVTVLTLSSSLFYIRCSKRPPFAHTQAVSRACHWSVASSMMFCPMLCHTHSTGADTARRCHLRISRRPAVALQPRSYWHNCTLTTRDARLHFSQQVAPKQPRYEPRGL